MTDTIGAGLEALAQAEKDYLMQTSKRQPVELVRGDKWNVYDPEGREYLDFVAGIAVNVLGHNHPAIVAAVSKQAAEAIHVSDLYYSRPQVELAKKLRALGFEGRMFPANSGAEANECAYKVARSHRTVLSGVQLALEQVLDRLEHGEFTRPRLRVGR